MTSAPSSLKSRWETFRPILKIVVPVLLFLVAVATLAGGWQQLSATRIEIQPATAAAAFVALLITIAWASLVWTYLARVLGAPLSWRDGVRIYATSNLGKYLPGKVGHILARVYLAREKGVPISVGTAAVVVDVVLYLSAALSFAVLALPLFFPSLGALASVVGVLALLVGLGLLHPRALNRVFRLLGKRLPGGAAFQLDCGYPAILGLFALYLSLVLVTTMGMLLSLSAIQALPLAAIGRLGAIYGVSYLAGLAVPVAPNGIGVREGVMATMLDGTMTLVVAGAASLLFRVLQVGAEAIWALVASRL
jgi:uncharacterized membrane protein YbhN (UPF0104 family)